MKYFIDLELTEITYAIRPIEVEADNEKEALEKAKQIFTESPEMAYDFGTTPGDTRVNFVVNKD